MRKNFTHHIKLAYTTSILLYTCRMMRTWTCAELAQRSMCGITSQAALLAGRYKFTCFGHSSHHSAADGPRGRITCMEEILMRKVIVEPQTLPLWLVICELHDTKHVRTCSISLSCQEALCLLEVHDSKDKPNQQGAQLNIIIQLSYP